MKLGTHNSMSYLPPKRWYMCPFRFIARCQSQPIDKQYSLGARMFDLRISFDDKGNPEFRHGAMAYKGIVEEYLQYLNSKDIPLYVRVILENSRYTKDKSKQSELFVQFCTRLEKTYPNLKFFCGRRKFDWNLVYKFSTDDPQITQLISSMTWKIWDDWFPWLYARFMNKKNIANFSKDEWVLIDFIEIQ